MNLRFKEPPRVLVVGGGAREHAIAWKLHQSGHNPVLYAAPGNAGISEIATLVDIAATEVDCLVAFAKRERIDLVFVGPEAPLSLGLVDRCLDEGIRAFGPTAAGARVEASKAYAKALMTRAGIPTAEYELFDEAEVAKQHVRRVGAPVVIKADGLAAGKGVVVATTVQEACDAIDDMLVGGRFGSAGARLVVESFLQGQEVSLMYFVDGSHAVPMLPARDYKRVGDGDAGGNTGGMGAFAPVPGFMEQGSHEEVTAAIVQPLLAALREDGVTYRGVLYVGLMMTQNGPQVVEFNCRFGDPETEVVLPLLDTDLLELAWAITEGELASVALRWKRDKAVCVVAAAPGYPDKVEMGSPIVFGETRHDGLFHAGTKHSPHGVITDGGRVLVALGVGATFHEARTVAYANVQTIYFEGKHYRGDIALGV